MMRLSSTSTTFHKLATLGSIIGICVSPSEAQQLSPNASKFLGAGTSQYIFRYFHQYWNQVSPGNDGKWGSVEATQGVYNWTNLDAIYQFAQNRNLLFKEHALVWGNQQPGWINSLDSSGQRAAVENWISALGQRYPNMDLVDVVNEPFNAPPSYMNAIGGDGATGWDWVVTAFQWARQYCDSNAKLILNEYNVLQSNAVTTNYLALIDTLDARGLIDGIGVQGHYFEFRSDLSSGSPYVYNVATIKSNLDRLTATGIPVYITEFDIDEPVDSNQLAQCQIYFPIFWENPGVKGITLWGFIQNDVWNAHPNTYVIRTDESERPALAWLRIYILTPRIPVSLTPAWISDVSRLPRLAWRSSDSADTYQVQISLSSLFSTVVADSTLTDTVFYPDTLAAATRYYWRVRASNEYGTSAYSTAVSFVTGTEITSVSDMTVYPERPELLQNYPNPFNSSTTVHFRLPQRDRVQLILLNVLGQVIANLAEGEFDAGQHRIDLDAGRLSSGVYVCRLVTDGGFMQTREIVLIR